MLAIAYTKDHRRFIRPIWTNENPHFAAEEFMKVE